MVQEFKVTLHKKQMFIGWQFWGKKNFRFGSGDINVARQIVCDWAKEHGCLPRDTKWRVLGQTHILSDDGPLCDNEGRPAENHRIEMVSISS